MQFLSLMTLFGRFVKPPEPMWYIDEVEYKENEVCSTDHSLVSGDIDFAKTLATTNAREKLVQPIIESLLPYAILVEEEVGVKQELIIEDADSGELILKMPYSTKVEQIEVLQKYRKEYLWAKVCTKIDKQYLTSIFNEEFLKSVASKEVVVNPRLSEEVTSYDSMSTRLNELQTEFLSKSFGD